MRRERLGMSQMESAQQCRKLRSAEMIRGVGGELKIGWRPRAVRVQVPPPASLEALCPRGLESRFLVAETLLREGDGDSGGEGQAERGACEEFVPGRR